MWPSRGALGPGHTVGSALEPLVQASGRLSPSQRLLGRGRGVPADPVSLLDHLLVLGPVAPSTSCTPVCTGSCLPGRRLGQGVPSFLTSDLTCFPIKTRIEAAVQGSCLQQGRLLSGAAVSGPESFVGSLGAHPSGRVLFLWQHVPQFQ